MPKILLLNLLILAGCTTPPAPNPDEARINAAVKERYWRMQAAQQHRPPRIVNVLQPGRVEDGARRVPTPTQLAYP